MRDSAEAYIGDIPSPLKRMLPDYRDLEQLVQAQVNDLLDLGQPCKTLSRLIKHVDRVVLAAESEQCYAAEHTL